VQELKSIQGFLQQVTSAFAGVVDIEIGVISKDLEVIAGSGYFEKEVGAIYDEGCMTHRILSSPGDDSIFVENTAHAVCCNDCHYAGQCEVLAFMMQPITFNGYKIGTISLLALNEQHRRKLLNHYDKMQDFLNKLNNMIYISFNEKKMEARVTSLMNQFKDVINSVNEGIIAINLQGSITNINKAAGELLGLEVKLKQGHHIKTLFPDFNLDQLIANSEIDNEQYYSRELVYNGPERKNLQLYYNVTLMYEEGRVSGAVISFKRREEVEELANRILKANTKSTFSGIVGTSTEISSIKNKMQLVAATDSTILIRGETGTGKSIFARAIHEESPRCKSPFVAISCAAIPAPLLESELFGYEEGAFTGARKGGKPGKFELAHSGTIFLDEIARIGGVSFRDVDVRIIAATNRDLEKLISEGKFREDLYYRINVIPFTLPVLRERTDDILLLMHHFLDYYSGHLEKRIVGFREDAREALLAYPWPGNVRELENAVEYAVNIEADSRITRSSLPEKILKYFNDSGIKDPEDLDTLETMAIKAALLKYGRSTHGKEKAASALGISRATLYRKLKELQTEVS